MTCQENDEQNQFKDLMDNWGVTPISGQRAPPKRPLPSSNPNQSILDDKRAMQESLDCNPEDSLHSIETDEELQKPGVRNGDFRDMKRGKVEVQAYIDLHGYKTQEAKVEISRFISSSVQGNKRYVRIVHGKGNRSRQNIPILKHLTYAVLTRNKHVLAYCRAPAHDGGSGATYAMLKKIR